MKSEPWYIRYDTSYNVDLNKDGAIDAIVVLLQKCGGTGTFVFLVPVLNVDGKPMAGMNGELGDRIPIRRLGINRDTVIVDALVAGPEDGLCCPSQPRTFRYLFRNDSLVFIR